MDESSMYFQMFLTLLSFIKLCSESQTSVFKQCQSNTQMSVFVGGGNMRRSEKKLHKALRMVQLLASFIIFFFEILVIISCMW